MSTTHRRVKTSPIVVIVTFYLQTKTLAAPTDNYSVDRRGVGESR